MERQRRDTVLEEKRSRKTCRDAESESPGPPLGPGVDERCRRDAREEREAEVRNHRPSDRRADRAKRGNEVEEQAVKRRRHAEGPHEPEPREEEARRRGFRASPEEQGDSENRE